MQFKNEINNYKCNFVDQCSGIVILIKQNYYQHNRSISSNASAIKVKSPRITRDHLV